MFHIRHCDAKGRGLFAKRSYTAGEVIERAPVIVIPARELPALDRTVLYNYTYAWGAEDAAIALGHGSLYNHSYQPNAVYLRDLEAQVMIFQALRAIKEGEEITINYNGDPTDTSPLWFEVADEAGDPPAQGKPNGNH